MLASYLIWSARLTAERAMVTVREKRPAAVEKPYQERALADFESLVARRTGFLVRKGG